MVQAAAEAGIDPDHLSFTQATFQINEAIDDGMVFAHAHQEKIAKRMRKRFRQNLLPERHLRINRREIKQVYNKHKPKKRGVPPAFRLSKLMNASKTSWSSRFVTRSLCPSKRGFLPLIEMY